MANNVSFIIQLKNQFSANARRIKQDMSGIKNEANRANSGFSSLKASAVQSLKSIKKESTALKKSMGDFGKSLSLKVGAPLAALGGLSVKQSANLESLRVSFDTMTGSAEKGKQVMDSLVNFTAKTPFQLEGVANAGKQLLAFQVPIGELNDKLQMLGDIAAGVGRPLGEIAPIFGKIKAKGTAMTMELDQLTERGIPILTVLAKELGKTEGQIREMAPKGQLSFELIEHAMKKMTSQGGMFFNMMQKQSTTTSGLFSTLKDNISLTGAVIGDIIIDTLGLKAAQDKLIKALEGVREKIKVFAEQNPIITKIIAAFGFFLIVIGPLIMALGQMAIALVAIKVAAAVLGVAFGVLALKIMLIVAAVSAVVAAGLWLKNNWDNIIDYLMGKWGALKASIIEFKNSFMSVIAPLSKLFGVGDATLNVNTGEVKNLSTPVTNSTSNATARVEVSAAEGAQVRSVRQSRRGRGASINIGENMAPA